MPEKDAPIPEVKERNIFNVLVNKNDRLFINKGWGDIRTLRADTKEFLSNPRNREDLPEKKVENIQFLGDFPVSRGVISLKNDRGTSYNMYIQVQNELTAAVNELRDELSRQKFGKPYSELTDQDMVSAIQKAIPMSISEAEPEDIGGTK